MTLREYLKSIADVLRNNLSMGEDEKINAQDFTSHIDTVAEANWESGYNSGYERGHNEGGEYHYNEGYSSGFNNGLMEGKQAEYDAFWDTYQANGERTDYTYGFSSWRTGCFYPKYDINIVGSAYNTFYNWNGEKIDLSARLEECGVKIDASRATSFEYTFYSPHVNAITRIPKIDTSGADRLAYTFSNSPALITIDEVVLREDGSQTFGGPFDWSTNLTNLKVSGTIGTSGFKLNTNAKLSKESIISVVNALSSTVTGQAQTFSLTAVNNAFTGGSTGSEWQTLIATKPNWTISLV